MSAGQPAFPLIRRPQTRPGGAFTIPQYHNITRKHKKKSVTKPKAKLFHQSDVWRKDGCPEFDFRQGQRVISLPPR